ncbi:type IIL restriction-modification enzyme MmeI [Aestuariimicrobium sp. T2.26MG-19.2B]|uniref:type IIL restriction-modification enzyme MmeI n=1 Tax=Aestuariimicrobium sp. T2.26MG-19.2B TaxID=3040679 RepID=UPI00406C4C8E
MENVKALSRLQIHENLVRLRHSYRSVTRERAEAQSFWNDLLEAFGMTRRERGGAFERPARRASTDSTGYIDLFIPGAASRAQVSWEDRLTWAS